MLSLQMLVWKTLIKRISYLVPQQTLAQLDESRAALGLLLDQCKVLQTEPAFAASVGQAGGALELRWRSAFRRTEQEVQRCRDIQNIRARWEKCVTVKKQKQIIVL